MELVKWLLFVPVAILLLWSVKRFYWWRRKKLYQRQELHSRALGQPRIGWTCTHCGQMFTRMGRVRQNRALGGAECRYCGNFYCERCVSAVIHGGSGRKRLTCACGKSKAWLGDDGCVAMDNFEELVVFRA
jgi:hypothetical protein